MAYAKALEIATGVPVQNMVPIPDLSNRKFDHSKKFEDQELSNVLYTRNDVGHYTDISKFGKEQILKMETN